MLVRRVSIAMIGDSRAGGSMSDTSKRRGFIEEDENNYREWSLEYNLRKAQELLEPEKQKKEFFLPKGMESIEKCGRILITINTWKKENLTFAKALFMSEHNEKIKTYLKFILAKFGE